ncbi:MAG: O-methyltransferase [Aquificae bacterium]|nr:O-methyltransferase [Aquificota bacterium]
MNFITNPDIESYIYNLSVPRDPILLEMEEIGHETGFPIVDRIVGRLLYILSKIKDPKLIVELGSGFGYSGYWFAKALDKGKIVLTDLSPENLNLAKKFFTAGNLLEKAEFKVGEAVEIASMYKNIDILFIDIQKTKYKKAVETLKENLSIGGIIIADNTLWKGKVIEKNLDKQTKAIKEFNEYMFSLENFFSVILPVRDGVLVSYKIK